MPKKKKKTAASTKKTVKKESSKNPQKEPKKKLKLFKSPKKKEKKVEKKETKEKVQTGTARQEAPKVTKKEKQRLTPVQMQKIKGGALMLIGLFTIVFIGYFLFGKLFSAQDIAEITPADKTIAVFELTVDANNGQIRQFYDLMSGYPVYQKENIIRLIEAALPYDFENELEPWMGRKIGFALFDTSDSEGTGSISPIIFIESRDKNTTIEFLKENTISQVKERFTEKDYNGRKIYEFAFSQKAVFTFVNNYLVVAENEGLITNYLDSLDGPVLNDDPDYRKVANNLPRGGLVFAYINLKKTLETLEKDKLFVTQKGQDLLVFKPFLDVFKAEGLSVFVESNRFTAQTFTAIDNELLDGENYITFSEKYQGELLSYANDAPIFMVGGHDLTKEINRIEDIFKSGTKTPALVFEGMIEAQKQIYFGKDISLNEDILPLLTGEYLFSIEGSFENPVVTVLIEMQNKNSDIPRLEKVINAFVEVSGIFTPKIQEVALPDGTVGQEIVASPENIQKDTENYNGNTITSLKLGETGVTLRYAVIDNFIAISTEAQNIKDIIDRHEGKLREGLTESKYYANQIAPVLRTADELMLLKIGAITEALNLNADQYLAPYLVPYTNLTITKNYFRDGISTIYLVEVI